MDSGLSLSLSLSLPAALLVESSSRPCDIKRQNYIRSLILASYQSPQPSFPKTGKPRGLPHIRCHYGYIHFDRVQLSVHGQLGTFCCSSSSIDKSSRKGGWRSSSAMGATPNNKPPLNYNHKSQAALSLFSTC